jgi:hypothetical protein
MGTNSQPMTIDSGVSTTVDTCVYAQILSNGSGSASGPNLLRKTQSVGAALQSAGVNGAVAAASRKWGTNGTGQTSLPALAPSTISAGNGPITFWGGVR